MDPKKINDSLLFLAEVIRLEGYIMKENLQGAAVSNKDTHILSRIENSYKKLFPDRKVSKHLIVMLYPQNKKITKIVDSQNNSLRFHYDAKGRLTFIRPLKNFNIKSKYQIYSDKSYFSLNILVDKNGLIATSSEIHSTSYATIQIYNRRLMENLVSKFKIPYGIGSKKSYIIDLPYDLNRLSNKQLAIIFDVIISCEGCVFYGKAKGDRVLKIKLASENYLEKISQLFESVGIRPQPIRRTTDGLFILDIRKRKNFKKIYNFMTLTSKKKFSILKEIVTSYSSKRFAHYEADKNYLKFLNQKSFSAGELARLLKRSENVTKRALNRLFESGYLNQKQKKFGKNIRPSSVYSLNHKGKIFLSTHL